MTCTHTKLEYLPTKRKEARCKECDWRSHNWNTGGVDGNAHAKEFGHKVEVTQETSYLINPYNK